MTERSDMPSGAATRLPSSRMGQCHEYTSEQQNTHLPVLTLSMQSVALAPNPLSPLPAETQPSFPYPSHQRRPRSAGKQLPPQTSAATQLNAILGAGEALSIDYDIRRPIASAACLPQGGLPHTGDWLYQAVTTPGLESVTIRSAFMGDVPIVVFPSEFPSGHAQVVCVEDVLQKVHQAALDHLKGWRCEGGLGLVRRGSRGHCSASYGSPSLSTPRSESGWRWKGLVASKEERDVWILLLQ